MAPITPQSTEIIWKLKSAQRSENAPADTLILSLAMKYSWPGCPPVDDGVMELKKNPANAYLRTCAKVV